MGATCTPSDNVFYFFLLVWKKDAKSGAVTQKDLQHIKKKTERDKEVAMRVLCFYQYLHCVSGRDGTVRFVATNVVIRDRFGSCRDRIVRLVDFRNLKKKEGRK